MPQLVTQVPEYDPEIGYYSRFGQNDKAMTSQVSKSGLPAWSNVTNNRSSVWRGKESLAEARRRLRATASLERGWDTYDAESPNDLARARAAKILDALEADFLPPTRLMPSSEGGIAISIVEGDRRAEIEIYNTGQVVVATYSAFCEPVAWELSDADSSVKDAIKSIRVYLAT